jgi:hypothetical protein
VSNFLFPSRDAGFFSLPRALCFFPFFSFSRLQYFDAGYISADSGATRKVAALLVHLIDRSHFCRPHLRVALGHTPLF